MANTQISQEVINAVSSTIEGIGTEVGEHLQVLARQANSRYLAVRKADSQLILRIPLTIGLVSGIILLLLTPVRKAALLMVGVLFARVYLAVEAEDDNEPTVAVGNEAGVSGLVPVNRHRRADGGH